MQKTYGNLNIYFFSLETLLLISAKNYNAIKPTNNTVTFKRSDPIFKISCPYLAWKNHVIISFDKLPCEIL